MVESTTTPSWSGRVLSEVVESFLGSSADPSHPQHTSSLTPVAAWQWYHFCFWLYVLSPFLFRVARLFRAKLARISFYELRNFFRKTIRNLPNMFRPFICASEKRSCKNPTKSSARFPCKRKIKKNSLTSFCRGAQGECFQSFLSDVRPIPVMRPIVALWGGYFPCFAGISP